MADRGRGPGRSDSTAGPGDAESGLVGRVLASWPGRVAVGVVVLVVVLLVLAAVGVVGAPSTGLVDRGDWGTVTDERTEVITTVWVDNPNPVSATLGNTLSVDYEVGMNGVVLAEGDRSDLAVPPGNTTHQLRTDLLNDRLPEWWVAFVRANETVELAVDATLTVDTPVAVSHDVTIERTMMDDATPVISALSSSVNSTSGTYTRSVDAGSLADSLDLPDIGGDTTVTAGYEVQRGWATWESVEPSETTARLHLLVHNPGDVPVPASPDGVAVTVDGNDVRLFEADSGAFTVRSVGPDAVIRPGETREVTMTVRMDNERVDEWFTSHVRADVGPGVEATTVSAGVQLVFELPGTDTRIRLPPDSPATYDCEFRTAILVDGRDASTTCGDSPVRTAP